MFDNEKLPVISLFSGAGGLDLAVEQCGEPPLVQDGSVGPLAVAVATDYEPDAVATMQKNFDHPVIERNIMETPTDELLEIGGLKRGDAALVIGGPPCTPFSKSGFWIDYKRESRDPNASLLDEFARVVEEARPEAFILENVQGLTYKTHRVQMNRFLERMVAAGYNPRWKLLNAADFGVPQLRKRVFIVGRRDGQPWVAPEPTHSGWTEHSKRIDLDKRPYVTAGEALADVRAAPEPGEIVDGTWGEHAAEVPAGENYLWHTERGGGRNEWKWRSRYWTFLLRNTPERPSTTLQAQPGPWVGPFHWENVPNADGQMRARRLRHAENLALMTWREDFEFVGSARSVQKQIGNAVPVELGKAVIRSLMEQLGHLPMLEADDVCPVQLELAET